MSVMVVLLLGMLLRRAWEYVVARGLWSWPAVCAASPPMDMNEWGAVRCSWRGRVVQGARPRSLDDRLGGDAAARSLLKRDSGEVQALLADCYEQREREQQRERDEGDGVA